MEVTKISELVCINRNESRAGLYDATIENLLERIVKVYNDNLQRHPGKPVWVKITGYVGQGEERIRIKLELP